MVTETGLKAWPGGPSDQLPPTSPHGLTRDGVVRAAGQELHGVERGAAHGQRVHLRQAARRLRAGLRRSRGLAVRRLRGQRRRVKAGRRSVPAQVGTRQQLGRRG